jgi:hypothetical protein
MNRIEQFEGAVPSRSTSIQYDSVLSDMQSYQTISDRYRQQAPVSPDVELMLRKVPMTDSSIRAENQQMRSAEVDNARSQLESLRERAGQRSRDGLNREELTALSRRTDLNENQRRAVNFMLDNYDALKRSSSPLGLHREAITGDSLTTNRDKAYVPPKPEHRQADAREVAEALDKAERKDRRGAPREARPDDVVVKDGWGWWQVTREYMRVNGIPYTEQAWRREQARLQKLNPDKVDMLHPKDRIRTR